MTKRFEMVIGLKADRMADYKHLGADIGPGVVGVMRSAIAGLDNTGQAAVLWGTAAKICRLEEGKL